MKTTALTHVHEALRAKMVEFAGYKMPVLYSGINDEHETVRTKMGVFDVSHMGEFILKGPGALDLIQRVTSNDASKLFDGKVQYSCLPNEDGGIVDDLLVFRFHFIELFDYLIFIILSIISDSLNFVVHFADFVFDLLDFV